MKVFAFDKGIGFALLNDIYNISTIEEQLGKTKIVDCNPTNLLAGKFQRLLQKHKKEDKFDKKMYPRIIYLSNCIPPILCRALKTHKLEKNYSMRAVVSTVGSALYGTSKYLIKIIQPTISKSKHSILNSSSFVEGAKEWNISPNEIQTSFDVDKALALIIEISNNDIDDL